MTLDDYNNNIKDFSYIMLVEYLNKAHGKAKYPYMTTSFNRNPKCSRTKEGLFVHHVEEYKVATLSHRDVAIEYPYEYQLPDYLCYADWYEHILLHLIITEHCNLSIPSIMVEELLQIMSGWQGDLEWQKPLVAAISDKIELGKLLLKRLANSHCGNIYFEELKRDTEILSKYGRASSYTAILTPEQQALRLQFINECFEQNN